MTRRPFPEIDSPRVLPDRRRPDPWPFIALIALAGIGGFLAWVGLDRQDPISTTSGAGVAVSRPDDGPLLTVVAWLVMTSVPEPTQTPDVRIVTATPTATPVPEQLPICAQAALGEVCLDLPPMMTATSTPEVPWCDRTTPSSYGYPSRCRSSSVATARDEIGGE